jgi:6-phosphofructokinase 1
VHGEWQFTPLDDLPRLMDYEHSRPRRQWWMDLRPIAKVLAQPGPEAAHSERTRDDLAG